MKFVWAIVIIIVGLIVIATFTGAPIDCRGC
jgi:hypothetical protein